MEYIRMCVDEDVGAARRALARATLGYALGRPGVSKAYGYRAHFTRMGFDEVLSDLEARRDAGATADELADACPDHLLSATSYFGPPAGAARPSGAWPRGWTRPSCASSLPAPALRRWPLPSAPAPPDPKRASPGVGYGLRPCWARCCSSFSCVCSVISSSTSRAERFPLRASARGA